MLSYAKSATARHRLNGFKNGKTLLFNSWGDIKWACFPKKWSVPLSWASLWVVGQVMFAVCSQALLEFLRKVVAYEEKNRMSLWNVSMIVAPNLFTFRGKSVKQEEMQGAVAAAQLVRLLITHQDLLWTVSSMCSWILMSCRSWLADTGKHSLEDHYSVFVSLTSALY